MKIWNFITSLLPSFKKDRIIEDTRLTRMEIREATLPAYHNAVELFKGWKFKSAELKDKNATFKRMTKLGNGNIVENIESSFETILRNFDTIEEMVLQTFMEDVSGGGITYLKANLLQLVDMVGFVSKYARKFLIYVYVCETKEYPEDGSESATALMPIEIEWLNANFLSFCAALDILTGTPDSMKKNLDNIPDIRVTKDNAQTLNSSVGQGKIDPFNMGLVDRWFNPIYCVRLRVAEWQAERYKAAKEELQQCQLRCMNLKKLHEGKPDARLQQEIVYMESRVQGLNANIAKMEKEYA